MAYVFGTTLICADNASASAVAFDKDVSLYSVSADGTAYDPSGTLSGGAAPSGSGILVKVQRVKELESQLRRAQAIAGNSDGPVMQKRKAWKDLVRLLEIKEHEVHLLEEQIGGSSASMVSIASSLDLAINLTLSDTRLRMRSNC